MMDVLVPAWNEELVIGACLASVLRDAEGLDLRVVVAANGCTDATEEVARSFAPSARRSGHDLVVLSLPGAGKANAIAAAERHARTGARVYLDADVVLGPGALRELDGVLGRPPDTAAGDGACVLLAAPRRVPTVPEHPVCRSHLRVWSRLPGVDGVIGGGCYAISAAGRRRWGSWPDVVADDAFVRSRFGRHEQRVLASSYLAHSPETPSDLAAVVRRWHRGNAQLATQVTERPAERVTASARGTVAALLRSPSVWPDLPAFVGVTAIARRGSAARWERDDGARSHRAASPP